MQQGSTGEFIQVTAYHPVSGVLLDNLTAADFPDVKIRNSATAVTIPELTDLDSDDTWVSGGIYNLGDGEYLFGAPDASWVNVGRTTIWGKSDTVEIYAEPIEVTPSLSVSGNNPSGALTTLEMVKALSNMADNTYSDDELTNIIIAVSNAAERWCNRIFAAADYTDKLDGDLSDEVILKHFPAISVTSFTFYRPDGTTDEFDVTDDLLYENDKGFIYINHRSTTVPMHSLPYGRQNIWVTYRAGFEAIPLTVQQGVAEWVADVCLRTTRDPSLTSEQIKGYSWKAREDTLMHSISEPPPSVRMLLASYKDVRP